MYINFRIWCILWNNHFGNKIKHFQNMAFEKTGLLAQLAVSFLTSGSRFWFRLQLPATLIRTTRFG